MEKLLFLLVLLLTATTGAWAQLAARSGYRSYRTFSVAFKQRTGQSVKDWIAEHESSQQSNKE